MPRYIINLRDEKHNQDNYMEWSTIVDAPLTDGMTLDEFKEYYQNEYGHKGILDLDERMERVNKKGTSAIPYDSVDQLISCNRAGEHMKDFKPKMIKDGDEEYESYSLTKEELLDEFCRHTYVNRK